MNYSEALRRDHKESNRKKEIAVSSVVKYLSESLSFGYDIPQPGKAGGHGPPEN